MKTDETTLSKTLRDIIILMSNGYILKYWGSPENPCDAYVGYGEITCVRSLSLKTFAKLIELDLVYVDKLSEDINHKPSIMKLTAKGSGLASAYKKRVQS